MSKNQTDLRAQRPRRGSALVMVGVKALSDKEGVAKRARGGVDGVDAGVQLPCPPSMSLSAPSGYSVGVDWGTTDFDLQASRDDKVPLWHSPSPAHAYGESTGITYSPVIG